MSMFGTDPDPWALPPAKTQWTHGDEHEARELHTEPMEDDIIPQEHTSLQQSIWDNDNSLKLTEDQQVSANIVAGGSNIDDGSTPLSLHSDFLTWADAIRTSYNANSRDIIIITEIPEKEGLLFKHTNYLVKHLVPLPDTDSTNDRKVVRRYSDFFWLLEVLLKKYPFRLIPELPPKKIASNSDAQFLERRKKGLTRFINQIMRHPILSQEPLVLMFLTVPTDLSSWRKQAQYDQTEEYHNRKITPQFKSLWDSNLQAIWGDADHIIKYSLGHWNKLTILIERFQRRSLQIAQDNERFLKILGEFKATTSKLYPVENSQIGPINEDLKLVGKHIDDDKTLINDQCLNLEESTIEDFKNYGDVLNALRSLFDRYSRFGGNQIGQLQKKLEFNKSKLQELNQKPDAKGVEVDRYKDMITRDEAEIEYQTNRDWLIKETVITEIVMFQESQFQITKVFQDWIGEKLKYSELQSNNWGKLMESISEMPLSRNS